MSASSPGPQVLIRLGSQWSPVGHASVIHDAPSGMLMLRIELRATSPLLYISLKDLALLCEATVAPIEPGIESPTLGHA